MTILDKLLLLMNKWGVDTTGVNRIDVAVDRLIASTEVKQPTPAKKDTKPKKESKVEETAED